MSERERGSERERKRERERERAGLFIRAKRRAGGYFRFARLPAKDPSLTSSPAVAIRSKPLSLNATGPSKFESRRRRCRRRRAKERRKCKIFHFFGVVVVPSSETSCRANNCRCDTISNFRPTTTTSRRRKSLIDQTANPSRNETKSQKSFHCIKVGKNPMDHFRFSCP